MLHTPSRLPPFKQARAGSSCWSYIAVAPAMFSCSLRLPAVYAAQIHTLPTYTPRLSKGSTCVSQRMLLHPCTACCTELNLLAALTPALAPIALPKRARRTHEWLLGQARNAPNPYACTQACSAPAALHAAPPASQSAHTHMPTPCSSARGTPSIPMRAHMCANPSARRAAPPVTP